MRLLLAFTLLAGLLSGETKPNFTGEWKMNTAKSDFGRLPPPASIVRKIEHTDPEMKISSVIQSPQGEVTANYRYTTDGKPAVNKVRDLEVKGAAAWEGANIVIESERPLPDGATVKTREKWTLSQDGKTLTWVTRMSLPQGDLTTIAVMDKQ